MNDVDNKNLVIIIFILFIWSILVRTLTILMYPIMMTKYNTCILPYMKTTRERKRKIHLWFNNIQIMRHVYCLKYKYVQVSHSNTWIHYMMEDDPQWVERGAVSPNREQSIQLYGLWVWGSSLSIRSAISSFVECPMFSRPVFWIVLCS